MLLNKGSLVAWTSNVIFLSQQSAKNMKSSAILGSWTRDWSTLNKSCGKNTKPLFSRPYPTVNNIFSKPLFKMLTYTVCWHGSSQSATCLLTTWAPPHRMPQTVKWKLYVTAYSPWIPFIISSTLARSTINPGTWSGLSPLYPRSLSIAFSVVHSAVSSAAESATASYDTWCKYSNVHVLQYGLYLTASAKWIVPPVYDICVYASESWTEKLY